MEIVNLIANLPAEQTDEVFQELLRGASFRMERIVSRGQATPADQWYDQPEHEWVLLLAGSAALLFADETQPRRLSPGDHLLIPAHRQHRVGWTAPDQPTVWLALHFRAASPDTANAQSS